MSDEPNVPVVDLPRVNAVEFQFYDHTVGAHLVTADKQMARWIDELRSAPPAAVAVDIETHGLDVNKFTITCVTVAFELGQDMVALLFDPLRRAEHRGMLARVFDHADRLVFHGASFDIAPLYAHRLMAKAHIRKLGDTLVAARMVGTNAKAGRTLEDLANVFRVMDDDRTSMTEVFSARGLKKDDGWRGTDIDTPTYVVGALSDTVATKRLWGVPGVNGHGIMAKAARYLTAPSAGYGGHGVLTATDAEALVEDIQRVNAIVLERTARGYAVDKEFPQRFLEETAEQTRAAATTLAEAGIRPGNASDLVNTLDARGLLHQQWPRTDTGRLKADKKALEVFTGEHISDALKNPLVMAHRAVFDNEKDRGYVEKVVENAGPTGRLHPEIKILGASATGRMCLPENQRLLTRRGIVSVNQIRTGDRTLDADGRWTTVRAVHRYSDAPLRRYTLDDGIELICTPEHRWVTENTAGKRKVQPLDRARQSDHLRLTPPITPGVCGGGNSMTAPQHDAYTIGRVTVQLARQRTGELSDALRGPAETRRATVTSLRERWQTEGETCWVPEHAPRDTALHSVCDKSLDELWNMLEGASHYATNASHAGVTVLPTPNRRYAEAFALAGYRLGLRSLIFDAPAGAAVVLHRGRSSLANMVVSDAGEGDVWCVTTDSGTFTAWGEHGPYLTGNSASKPEIQQFPKRARGVIVADSGAEGWISADWKSIEPVVLATAAGDRQFIADMRAGMDPYEPVGQAAGIDRKLAKRKMLADMYGQGLKAASLQYGWSLDQARFVQNTIRGSLPILYKLIDALKAQSQRFGHVTTLTGRVVDQKFSFYEGGRLVSDVAQRIAPNHFCQGSALDIMHYAILELDRRGLSDHVHLWMHDEIVADKEIAEELAEVMATPPPFLEAVAQYHGIEAFLAVDVNEMGSRWEYV
ncbi:MULTISPECIES: DNA polymerase [Mycobacteroides]|uniref:DNA polymerase n=1 Tax=Mycobacteroides TaxID=670516 RepID=UPI0007162018|nr:MULTISPECIES: DNA polymerase [Mycobacteroides]KRQ24238.1 hypothetical protein AOT91_22285 [Mycobacteroides sp. H092]KRQ26025.1 hypothetical protein AOT87_07710 [Mycobacteroides sp. H003]KRQ39353.1 hypothetical protein AOT92_18900 [Mycobacteroides sp. H101]KRQ48730.1 hypothetical protein AOT88_13710 [Mycobacteroides sp. H063]KRQ58724.1 hypothetical protein AOT94_10685 [Mycobacteroides sp. HXVII]